MAKACPLGHVCPKYDMQRPAPCAPGSYQEAGGQTRCELCPYGAFCFGAGLDRPIKCTPGWTCQLEGSHAPAQLCPAGSYCHQATVTNQTNSTVREYYKPNYCPASAYCLAGVYTPFVDADNEQAAQACIAGTFCGAGSASPEGKGKCKEGFFCPPGSLVMIPTEPGFFAEGSGNVAAEKCRPGTWQDLRQQARCKPCGLGMYCDRQQMVQEIKCPEGAYSKLEGQTQCANCPLGTFSDEVGVREEDECRPCEPRSRCTVTGMRRMQEAERCQEGYQCEAGTTTTSMLNAKVLTGYYGGYDITGMAEYRICPPRKYCPAATAESKVRQLDCLRGFFCPPGTAGDLDLEGNFNPGTPEAPKPAQVDKWEQVEAIRLYLAESRAQMALFEEEAAARSVAERLERLRDAWLDETRTADERQIASRDWYRLEWRQQQYELNVTIVAERERYLAEDLLPTPVCEEDAALPQDLIDRYLANGTNLRCPRGTQSDRGSWCLGQCAINAAAREPISQLNPVTDVIGITSLDRPGDSTRADELGSLADRLRQRNLTYAEWLDLERDGSEEEVDPGGEEGTRRLAAAETDSASHRRRKLSPLHALNNLERDYDIVGQGVQDLLHRQTVRPLETAVVYFDFRELPAKLLYNEHFSVIIRVGEGEGEEYPLPYYLAAENNGVTNKRAVLKIRVFNWMATDQEFQVGLHLFHGLFVPFLEDLSDKVWIEVYRAERQTRFTDRTHAAVIGEVLLEGKTMPYNSPDYGNDPRLWLDFVATDEDCSLGPAGEAGTVVFGTPPEDAASACYVNPTTKNLDKDAFDSTYWQSKQISAVVMPWVPFFSNCNGFDSRIVFYDLFEYSGQCELPPYDGLNIVSPIPSYGLEPVADKCQFTIPCRYDEALTYKRSQTTRWYALQEETRMFYITREPVPIENFHKLEDSDTVQTFYNTLLEDGSDDLIPVPFVPA